MSFPLPPNPFVFPPREPKNSPILPLKFPAKRIFSQKIRLFLHFLLDQSRQFCLVFPKILFSYLSIV